MTDSEFGDRMTAILALASDCASAQGAAESALTWPWHRKARAEVERFAAATHAERAAVAALIADLRKARCATEKPIVLPRRPNRSEPARW